MESVLTQTKVTVNSIDVLVRDSETNSVPVLLLHGSPDTGEMWLPLIERLGDRVRSIAPDLPGFGATPMPGNFELTLENFADFIRDLLVALEITEPVVVVGTDFGGHYGLAFAVKYPELVRGVAISNTNFSRTYEWHSFAKLYRMPLLGEFLVAGSSKPIIAKSLKNFAPALPDDYIDKSYAAGFGSPSVRKAILRMYRGRDSKDFIGWDDQLTALLAHKPSIVLWGDTDPFITPDFADRFGAAQVHHFTENSHWLPLEAPDQYAQKLIAWLETL